MATQGQNKSLAAVNRDNRKEPPKNNWSRNTNAARTIKNLPTQVPGEKRSERPKRYPTD